jgi:hypothetical protein
MTSAPAVGSTRVSSRPAAFLSPRLPVILLIGAILLGAGIRIYYFDIGIARSPDERYYTRQANIILAQGVAGFNLLSREHYLNPTAIPLNPVRVGYLSLLAALMRLTEDTSVLAGAHLSLLCGLAALPVIAFTAFRALSPTVAIVATLFYAVFPFELATSRRAWQESFIAFLAIVIVSLAVCIARTHSAHRTASFIAFALLGVLSITTKENSGTFFLLCGAGLTLHFILKGDRRAAVLTASCAAAAILASIAILAALLGGLSSYISMEREFAHTASINTYDLQFNYGPAWMFPAGLFRTGPFLFLAALTGFGVALYRGFRSRAIASIGLPVGIALIAALMLIFQMLSRRYNFRYTAPAYGLICLLAGIGIDAILPTLHKLLAPLGRATAWAILGFAISVAAFRDFTVARDRFLLPELQDLALRVVLGVPPAPIPPDYPR